MLRSSVEVIPEYEVLLCPVCGFECVHIVKVKVATGERVFTLSSHGLEVMNGDTAETLEARQQRGARIILEYVCEFGHSGSIMFQFHKGVTFIEHETLTPDKEAAVLWRT